MKRLFVCLLVVISFALVVGLLLVWRFRPAAVIRVPSPGLSARTLPAATATQTPYDHIIVLVLENKSATSIIGNQNAPYLNRLIGQGALAQNYQAVGHPSLPNYLALLGGSTFGITSDCETCFINAPNLVDRLAQAHKTWKAYMEDMPDSCFLGSHAPYAQKHNPFVYFDDIRTNPGRCHNIVPLSQLSDDIAAPNTPNFIWITPNLCHDMHDCSIAQGDAWLSTNLAPIISGPLFTKERSLLIVTWDESEGQQINLVPTIFVGTGIPAGITSNTPYTHYALLHTIEAIWQLAPLTTHDQQSPVMQDMLH